MAEAPDSDTWGCSVCTYHNLNINDTCTMCQMGKRPGPPPTTTTPAADSGGNSELARLLQALISEDKIQGDLNVIPNYHDNPSRVLATWKVSKAKWADGLAEGLKSALYSEKFIIPYDGETFTFRFDLNPAGWHEKHQASGKYGLYMQFVNKPEHVVSISIILTMHLQEIESHKFFSTSMLSKPCGHGPHTGFGLIEDILLSDTEEFTYIADLRIKSILKKDAMLPPTMKIKHSYEGDPNCVFVEWHIPKPTWYSWEQHYVFPQRIQSSLFVAMYDDNECEFYLDLCPNGRNEAQQARGFYGLGVFLKDMPEYASAIHLEICTGLVGMESHSHDWTATLTSDNGTGHHAGSGLISEIREMDVDEVVFTLVLKISSIDFKYHPMPKKCKELLKRWRLSEYCKAMENAGMLEDEFWHEIPTEFLTDIGMKPGEILRFQSKAKTHSENLPPPDDSPIQVQDIPMRRGDSSIIVDEDAYRNLQARNLELEAEVARLKNQLDETKNDDEKERDSFSPVDKVNRWDALRKSKFYRWYERLRNRTDYYSQKEKHVAEVLSRFPDGDKFHLQMWHESCKLEEQRLFDDILNSFQEIEHLLHTYAELTNELQSNWDHMRREHDTIYQEFTEQIENGDHPISKRTERVGNPPEFTLATIMMLEHLALAPTFAFNQWLNEMNQQFENVVDAPHHITCDVKKHERMFFKTFYNLTDNDDDLDMEEFVRHPFKYLNDFVRAKFVFNDWESMYKALLTIDHHPMMQGESHGIAYYRNDFIGMSRRTGGFKSVLVRVKIPLLGGRSYMMGEVQLLHQIFNSYVSKTHDTYKFVRYFKFGKENLVQSVLDEEVERFSETMGGKREGLVRNETSGGEAGEMYAY